MSTKSNFRSLQGSLFLPHWGSLVRGVEVFSVLFRSWNLLATTLLALLMLVVMHSILMWLVMVVIPPILPSCMILPSSSLLVMLIIAASSTSVLTSTSTSPSSCPIPQPLSLLRSCPPLFCSWTKRPLFPLLSSPVVEIFPQIPVAFPSPLAQLAPQVSRWALRALHLVYHSSLPTLQLDPHRTGPNLDLMVLSLSSPLILSLSSSFFLSPPLLMLNSPLARTTPTYITALPMIFRDDVEHGLVGN